MATQEKDLSKDELFIIGIGSSAGGLEALTHLVASLPDDDRLAVVIAQHVSPDHKSQMVSLLSRHSPWPIVAAEDDLLIEPQHVYVTPPNCEITIVKGRTVLKERHRTIHAVPSIDDFFTSLAKDKGNHAIGIILSGTGKDGTKGIAAIQDQGGYILAQSLDDSQHHGMPEAAIQSGYVNVVATANEMAEHLSDYLTNFGTPGAKEDQETSLQQIFRLMTQKTGTDFSKYKPSTIQRRIDKRLNALSIENVDDYSRYVERHPEELDVLFETVLIGVTEFFRDKPTFDELRQYVRKIIAEKQPGDAIRLWSVGCASGEEPYSLAILLAEELGERRTDFTVQIFATDIDENGLSTGRRGLYADELLENVSEEQRSAYFNHRDDGFEVKKIIRQWLLFSKHDITRDPPFVRLDLVSCRNVLIYFNNDLQRKVLPVFHYALYPDGYLLLGKSENILQLSDLFSREDAKHKLFRKRDDIQLNTLTYTNFQQANTNRRTPKQTPVPTNMTVEELVDRTLVQSYDHPFMVVNEALAVVHVRGKLQPYLDLTEGSLNANILNIICRELHMELRTAFSKAKREAQPVRSNVIRFTSNNHERLVRLSIKPVLYQRNDNSYYLIIFEDVGSLAQHPFFSREPSAEEVDSANAIRVMELEHELAATKEHLQTFTEELETSNEELQAMNEELQSANEELKSSNEELETSNEELQSAVEELQTANSELGILNEHLVEKETELTRTTDALELNQDRFQLALDNSPIILFYQDIDLRYTWQYNSHPGLDPKKVVGKTDYELFGEDYRDVIALKVKAITTAQSVHTVVTRHNFSYDLTIKPVYKKGKVTGIKGVAINITEQVKAQRAIDENQAIIRSIIDGSEENILAVDEEFKVIVANPAQQQEFRKLFDRSLKPGDNILEQLRDYPDSQANTHARFKQALNGEAAKLERYQSTRLDEQGNARYYDIDIVPIRKKEGEIMGGAMLSREVTQRVIENRQIESIIERSANLTGDDFFKNLTEQIAELFKVKYTYIGLLVENDQVRTKALRINGKLAKNFTYGLKGVPCQTVTNNEEARYIEHVAQQFPDDPKLQQWNAESYLGLPISSPLSGDPLAILVMIDEKPLKETTNSDYVLNIFTLRAGAELERLRAEQQIREKERQIHTITENVADVIYELVTPREAKHYFRFISRAVDDLYELTPQQVLNDADLICDVIHEDDLDSFEKMREQMIQGEQDRAHWEGRIATARSGTDKWIILTAKTERQDNGDLVWYGTISDITLLKDAQLRLKEAKEEAEAAARAKEDFLATMSHEIRTPLNAIVGISNLLLDHAPQPRQVENLTALKFSSENLMTLINDILDFSKIEAGKVETEQVPFSLSVLLTSLQQAHQLQAREQHDRLTILHDPEEVDFVVGDQVKLGQILNNLLSNALKFTKDGQVTLSVTRERLEEDTAFVLFSVQDTGIGIPPDKLNSIFDKFTQADSSTRRHYGGTGLGLTITSKLLELMDSRIQVESEPGKGARFYFSLPLTLADEESKAALQEENPYDGVPLSSVRLLIVEDVPVNRMILHQYLQSWGNITADEATNGEEAVEKVKDHEYDLILMDVRMPIMDGYEATKIIRAMSDEMKELPIIALTADTSDRLKEQGIAYFTDVITKPFDPQDLNEKIARYTQSKRPEGDRTDPDSASVAPMTLNFALAEKPFNTADQLKNFYQIIHRSFKDYRQLYEEAMTQRDEDRLHNLLHKLKLTLAMFELAEFEQQLKQDTNLVGSGSSRAIQTATQRTVRQFDHIIEQVEQHQQELNIKRKE